MLVSVIITTYNWPQALAAVLNGLAMQTDIDFEVLVADDGSNPTTEQLLNQLKPQLPFSITHVWQADLGFRAAKIRNVAAAQAQGDYLIFLDGDCVPTRDFIAQHKAWALPKMFLAGQRVLVSQAFSQTVLANNINLAQSRLWQQLGWRLQNRINRYLPLVSGLRYLLTQTRQTWQGVKTCNLGVWREDFIKINGFDEVYQGWGFEDSDLAVRLLHAAVGRAPGRFVAPVFHLWHRESDRTQTPENYARLQAVLQNPNPRATQGVDQYVA